MQRDEQLRLRFPWRRVPARLTLASRTPLQRLERLSAELGVEILVKRDDLTHPVVGGNKVRKLEWLLAAACRAGAKGVITAGPAGSNHVRATALLAEQLGLTTRALLAPQPATPRAVATCRAIAAHADVVPCAYWGEALARLAGEARELHLFPIAPGGSTPLGTLGHVEAALELESDLVTARSRPPLALYVPVGTGGTAAGLAVGLGAAGLRGIEVVGVRVVPGPAPSWTRVLVAAAALRLGVRPAPLTLRPGFVAPGYGRESAASREARELLAATEGLELDPTYAAKALAALLADARAGARGPLLFWMTCPPQPPIADPEPASLPAELRHLFEE